MEAGIIFGQKSYELQRPQDYKKWTRSEIIANLTELGWVVSGLMPGKKRKVCHIAFTEDVKIADNIQLVQNQRPLPIWLSKSTSSVSQRKNCWHTNLEGTTKFIGEQYKVGMLRSEPEPNLSTNYSSLWSALLTAAKISKGPTPEQFISTFNRYRCGKGVSKRY